jgi:hypothetical protein
MMDASFHDFVQWSFYGVITLIATTGVSSLIALRKAVEDLNRNVAVVISRLDFHEKRLDRHEEILDRHQTKKE